MQNETRITLARIEEKLIQLQQDIAELKDRLVELDNPKNGVLVSQSRKTQELDACMKSIKNALGSIRFQLRLFWSALVGIFLYLLKLGGHL